VLNALKHRPPKPQKKRLVHCIMVFFFSVGGWMVHISIGTGYTVIMKLRQFYTGHIFLYGLMFRVTVIITYIDRMVGRPRCR
jgi:uncharacterized membrane protein YjjP (DUF1212 family)